MSPKPHLARRFPRHLLPVLLLAISGWKVFAAPTGFTVAVTPDSIMFQWDIDPNEAPGDALILQHPIASGAGLRVSVESTPTLNTPPPVWTGKLAEKQAAIPRFHQGKDRLFSKFTLQEASSDARGLHAEAQHVTDFTALPRRRSTATPGFSKKGIACLLDPADGARLGVRQLNRNISIDSLINLAPQSPGPAFEHEGRKIALHPGAVATLDRELRIAYQANQRVTGILLNNVGSKTPKGSPLVHPLTDPAVVPIGPSAFNTATEEGVFYYRAIVHWLVERYTREDAEFGRMHGLVIGNEMQSHWSWYHLGRCDSDTVIQEYAAALRIADLASRAVHEDFPVYVSLEHHWRMPASEDPLMGFTAVEALEGINAISKRGGDFPWNLAFHPYPENLMDPQFWKDRSAPLRFDAPRITFYNLEVLPLFLRQKEYLYGEKPRRIALTEQGFHCPKTPEGEKLQAAAFALSWKKVQAIPEIEAYLYHRHVDHPHENGLLVGLRQHDGTSNVNGIGKERLSWSVFQKAETPEEDDAFAFALPIVGRANWDGIVADHVEPIRQPYQRPARVFYDFTLNLKEGVPSNLQAVSKTHAGSPDEVRSAGFLAHPKPKGTGRLTFKTPPLSLKPGDKGSMFLTFKALLNHEKSSGAGFHLEIDGAEVFSSILSANESADGSINLKPWQGKQVDITFGVEALKDPAHDATVWLEPKILVLRP